MKGFRVSNNFAVIFFIYMLCKRTCFNLRFNVDNTILCLFIERSIKEYGVSTHVIKSQNNGGVVSPIYPKS